MKAIIEEVDRADWGHRIEVVGRGDKGERSMEEVDDG